MRFYFLVPFALIVPLVAAACSDEPSVTPETPPPPVAAADFMAAYTTGLCERASRCYAPASYLDAECESAVRVTFGEDVAAAIEAGRIVYDAAAAGACIKGLTELDCLAEQPSDATLNACLSALSGTIAEGAPCLGTFECKAGICPSVTGDTCPAVCPAAATKGEACSLLGGPDCDAREGLRCSQGTCVAPSAEGGACADNFACQSGLVCVTNLCVPLRGDHQGCSQDASCKPGFFCASGGDEGGVCEPRLALGQACGGDEAEDANAAARLVQCLDGLVCKGSGLKDDGTSFGGACADPSDLGGDCAAEPDGMQVYATGCRGGLVCDAGKCAKPATVGAACGKHFECVAGEAYCDPKALTCVALRANGEACAVDPECVGGYCGSMGKCTDLETFCGP